jgi:DUF971 family protein
MQKPKAIQPFPSGELGIMWEDGHESIYPAEYLRSNCPCAMCTHDLVRGLGIHPGRFKIVRVRQIGNYAIGIQWADGHDTGIYAYDYLKKTCPCKNCKK